MISSSDPKDLIQSLVITYQVHKDSLEYIFKNLYSCFQFKQNIVGGLLCLIRGEHKIDPKVYKLDKAADLEKSVVIFSHHRVLLIKSKYPQWLQITILDLVMG